MLLPAPISTETLWLRAAIVNSIKKFAINTWPVIVTKSPLTTRHIETNILSEWKLMAL